jgi:hypothetical protein
VTATPDHREFVEAYRAGQLHVAVDPALAARFVSSRLLLPFVAMPVIGIGIALCLVGHYIAGGIVLALGIAGPRLVKRSAAHFVVTQALDDPRFYNDAVAAGILRIDFSAAGNTTP